jgi:4'-phosphopantetheinyl transferase
VAVTLGRAVGLDLESIEPGKDSLPLAERFFTESETALLRRCDDFLRAATFSRLWTVKEAVLKARGLGVGSGLGTVEVSLDENGHLTSVLAPGGPWSAWAWEPEARLAAAVAVQGIHPPHLRAFRAAPLGPGVDQPGLLPRR